MKRNVTMIDDLPELEDEKDNGMTMRGIRPTMSHHQMQHPSMMMNRPPQQHPSMMMNQPQQQPTLVRMPLPVFDEEQPQPHMGFVSDVRNKFEDDKRRIYCIDVAEHISSCPICSKFYNVDKTPYILAIVILSIVCIILLKRVLSI